MTDSGTKAVPAKAKPEAPARTENAPVRMELPSLWSDPFGHMRRLGEDIERAFGGLGPGRGFALPRVEMFDLQKPFGEMAAALWSPQVEILERESKLVVRADLPGMTKENVHVEVEDNILTIKGERKTESEEKKEKFYRSERSYGSFFRSFRLPEGTDTTKVKATFKDGVLEVELPASAKPDGAAKKIEIEAHPA